MHTTPWCCTKRRTGWPNAADIAATLGESRLVTLARELTKTFETVRTLPAGELAQWIASDSNQQRGECVLIIDAAAPSAAETAIDAQAEHTYLARTAGRAAAQTSRQTGCHTDRRAARCLVSAGRQPAPQRIISPWFDSPSAARYDCALPESNTCPGGEIGRRRGLKIPAARRVGSSPTLGNQIKQHTPARHSPRNPRGTLRGFYCRQKYKTRAAAATQTRPWQTAARAQPIAENQATPITPPSSRRITTVAERGRPPAAPSGQAETAWAPPGRNARTRFRLGAGC